MRRSGNREENKRIIMDLDVVLKSHDCPYIVRSYGTFITQVSVFIVWRKVLVMNIGQENDKSIRRTGQLSEKYMLQGTICKRK